MKISMRPLLTALVLSATGFSVANSAHAGCGLTLPMLKPSVSSPSTQASPTLRSGVYRPGEEGQFLLISDDEGWPANAGIVGMWRFQLLGPDGTTVVDDGYAQWHSDGTEIQNSGVHAPDTSNFCLGVWQRIGPNKYRLNHLPLGWTGTAGGGGTNLPAAAIQIIQTVKLTDNDHMTGTFTLTAYSWDGSDGLNVGSMLGAPLTGTVTATRVTIYSTVPGAP
jgi:hypothetical protein